MITKNPMQLKAFIKNKAAEKHISAQLVMQNYRVSCPARYGACRHRDIYE